MPLLCCGGDGRKLDMLQRLFTVLILLVCMLFVNTSDKQILDDGNFIPRIQFLSRLIKNGMNDLFLCINVRKVRSCLSLEEIR